MSTKPKVALMSYSMDNRSGMGTALYARKLIEQLLRDDRFEWYLVHFDASDDELYSKAHDIVMPRVKLPAATRFVRMLLFFWKYRSEGFDIVHWFQPRMYPFFWWAPSRALVLTAHGAGDVTTLIKAPLSRKIFNFVLTHFNHKLDAIIGDTEFGREEIIQYYHTDPSRVHTIFLGGGELFTPIDKQEARTRIADHYGISQPFILDVSRLQPHKNVDAVIRAYIQMRTEHPEQKEHLVIVGWPIAEYDKTYELARSSSYVDDIHFIDHVAADDLNHLYSAASLFVFPSLNEGFGLPVVEAFAAGTAVITSNVTSLPEIGGDAAVIVDPRSDTDIAHAMHRVLSDDALRDSSVRKGLKRAALFTWKKTAADTMQLYTSILNRKR